MKLFFKDSIPIVILFLSGFLGLYFLINYLGSVSESFPYFIFLSLFLLVVFLTYRYLSNYRLYKKLCEKPSDLEDILINNPYSPLEKAFANSITEYYKIYHNDILLLRNKQEEYKFFLNQSVHQMKTPISVINLLAQNNKDFQEIISQTKKLDYSLSQTLTFLRLDDLVSDFKVEKIHLRKAVLDVVNDLKSFFIGKEVYPKVNIKEDIIVYTDSKLIRYVIYQVLTNAIKYGDKGSYISLGVDIKGDKKILSIMNFGIGIEKSDINRIFDLFYTGENGRKYGESTGVGLYIVKRIVDMLGHKIYVESHVNDKTTFHIEF